MSELDIIQRTPSPNTLASLLVQLKALGVTEGDTLLVHSSLSKIGWTVGGARTVIEALQTAVGLTGTIVMPAHSGHLSDPAQWENPPVPHAWVPILYETMPAFDVKLTETWGIGMVAERFRHVPGTKRSNHPHDSFCAKGKHAGKITKPQPLTPAFGEDSPLGRLVNLHAKVLFLGTDYDTCTCFHFAESQLPGMPRKRCGSPVIENGARVWKWFDDFDYDSFDFQALGEAFEQENPVSKGPIGIGVGRLFAIETAVSFAIAWLQANRKNTVK
jgi:aminoglycoside 3-N-acetyltransferase